MERPIPPLRPEQPAGYPVARLSYGLWLTFLLFPQLFLLPSLSRALRLRFCPPGTFMSGTLLPDLELAGIFAAVSFSMLVIYWIVALNPSLWSNFGFSGPRKTGLKHIGSHVWAGAFLICMAGYITAETSTFCLAADQITLRDAPWQRARRYHWSDVAAVQTSCVRTGKGDYKFNLYYGLSPEYGLTINIAESVPDFEAGYEPMMRAFAASGTHPSLDSHFIQLDCGYRNVGLLTRQP